jgi:hypothetical protein
VVGDRLQVADPRLETEVADVPVRQPVAPSSRKCRQTGLSQSCCRWLSQQVDTRSGGPVPETA